MRREVRRAHMWLWAAAAAAVAGHGGGAAAAFDFSPEIAGATGNAAGSDRPSVVVILHSTCNDDAGAATTMIKSAFEAVIAAHRVAVGVGSTSR